MESNHDMTDYCKEHSEISLNTFVDMPENITCSVTFIQSAQRLAAGHGTAFLSHPNKLREATITNFMYLFIALIREEQPCGVQTYLSYTERGCKHVGLQPTA